MKKIILKSLLVSVYILALAACNPEPMTGGPCEYEKLEEIATIKAVHDEVIVIEGSEIAEVNKRHLTEELKVGDKIKIVSMQITEGSCTPYNVQSVEKIKD